MKFIKLKKNVLLNITDITKTYICVLLLLFVGVYGFILDFYSEDLLIPNIELIPTTPSIKMCLPIYDKEIQISSVWSLFIIFGLMIFMVELLKIKSKYLVTAILTLIKYKMLLKWNEGMIEYVKWKRR